MADPGPLEPSLRALLPAQAPPRGFADTVLTVRREGPRIDPLPWWSGPRTRFVVGMATLVVGVAVLVLYPLVRPGTRPDPSSGGRETTARETIPLGGRGVAVAEPQAQLSWAVDRKGAARVTQTRGEVFYRVDPGGPFVVATPAGEATATGTCFRVALDPAASASAATATVAVAEGRVLLANQGGTWLVGPGERATLVKDAQGERALAPASAPAAP
jgi:transmembrane sensor